MKATLATLAGEGALADSWTDVDDEILDDIQLERLNSTERELPE